MSETAPEAPAISGEQGIRRLAVGSRLRVLTVARVLLAATVAVVAVVADDVLVIGDRTLLLVAVSAAYGAVNVAVLVVLRTVWGWRNVCRQVGLLADAGWAGALLWSGIGGVGGPVLLIVELELLAVTVVLGWRDGLKLALLDTVAVVWVVLAGGATGGFEVLSGAVPLEISTRAGEVAAVPVLGAVASLWLLWGATGYFSAVNERDLMRSNRELALLRDVSTELERSLELDAVSQAIADGLVDALGYSRAVTWLPDDEDVLQPVGWAGFDRDADLSGLRRGTAAGPVADAVDEDHPRVVARSDPRPVTLADTFEIDSALVLVPLVSGGRLLGLLTVEVATRQGLTPHLHGRELRVLSTLATEATLALDNARLHGELRDLSVTDALTGVYNHRHFQQRLREELDRSTRQAADGIHHPVSLIIMDLDRFKRINDEFGHPSGDELLRSFARLIYRVLRSTDIVCRYGGEEFGIILPATAAGDAEAAAERLREAVERSRFVGASGEALDGVTASLGVATHSTGMPSRSELIRRTDEAVDAAKEAGRNRVVHADHDPSQVAELAGTGEP